MPHALCSLPTVLHSAGKARGILANVTNCAVVHKKGGGEGLGRKMEGENFTAVATECDLMIWVLRDQKARELSNSFHCLPFAIILVWLG